VEMKKIAEIGTLELLKKLIIIIIINFNQSQILQPIIPLIHPVVHIVVQ